jgi:PAS domain S-box-containing protein
MGKKVKLSGVKVNPDACENELQFLANASLRINQLETSNEVADFVCTQIKTLVGTGYVSVSLLDDVTQTLSVKALKGLEDDTLVNSVLRLIGSDPRKTKVPIKDFTADDLAIYNSGRLEFLTDGIFTLMVRIYPRQICSIIERLLNINAVYTMGFVFHGRHIGGIAILADAGSAIEPNRLLIENIVAQAATILTRIRTEAALQESREKYRILLDESPDPIFCLTPAGTYTYANQGLAEVYGISVNEIVGKTLWDFFPKEEADKRFAALKKVFYTGKEGTVEGPVAGKESTLYYMSTISPIMDNQGNVLSAVCSSKNITERKQAEEALRESREQYRTLIDNANEAIVVAQDGELKYVNRTSLEVFAGYTEKDLLNMQFTSFIHPDDRVRILDNFQKRLRNAPMSPRNEYKIVMPDGTVKWVDIGTTIIQWKNRPATLNFITDITDRKKAEAELLESQTLHKAIVDSTNDMIWSVDPVKFGLLTFNRGLSEHYLKEYSLVIRPGMTPHELFFLQDYIDKWNKYYLRALAENNFTAEYIGASGKVTLELTFNTLKRDGKVFGISVFGKDISDRKLAEQEKKLVEEKAQVANRLTAVGEMAAGIAHEINNPLTSVIGFSKLVLEDNTIPAEMKEDLIVIAENSQRIANIVKGLLTFARQSKPLKTLVNLNELIDNTLKLREYVLKTNKIVVVTRYDPQLPWVIVDPAQLQQVFLNLIVNAEQAMKQAHGMGNLTITTEKKGNVISISFQDDGPGISAENMGRLFEPFFTTKEPGEGTGLGLSISRSIVLEHNGKFMAESTEGHGAMFVVQIPMIENQPEIAEAPTPVPEVKSSATKKGRILVIDDEPGVRALLDSRLTKIGHSVDTISDAASAMEMIDAGTRYDVIITDVRMPGMSGFELYTLILRKMPEMKNRFIFITGDVMGADIKAFIHQNHLCAFSKPFETRALLDKIESMLSAEHLPV